MQKSILSARYHSAIGGKEDCILRIFEVKASPTIFLKIKTGKELHLHSYQSFPPRHELCEVVFINLVNQKAGAGLEGAVAESGLAMKTARESADDEVKTPPK